jgi:hypothetical protein
MREAVRVMQAAGAAGMQAWQQGAGAEAAALVAERRARMLATQDVRTLMSFDDGRTLVPGRGAFGQQAGTLAAYIAVKHMGYWAEAFMNAPPAANMSAAGASASEVKADELRRRVNMARDALLDAAAPGVAARTLHALATEALGNYAPHPVLGGSVGRRIGLDLNEGGDITRGAAHALAPGEVYALHVGARDASAGAIASALIIVTANGTEQLHRSSRPGSPPSPPANEPPPQ